MALAGSREPIDACCVISIRKKDCWSTRREDSAPDISKRTCVPAWHACTHAFSYDDRPAAPEEMELC